MISALFGLGAALSWGTGDFAGGIASRKVGPYRAVFVTETLSFLLILLILPFKAEAFPAIQTILWSVGSGIFSTFGLLSLFIAMQHGRISIAAPISAVLAAIVPVVAGIFIDGFPRGILIIAFMLALVAVTLLSKEKVDRPLRRDAGHRLLSTLWAQIFPHRSRELVSALSQRSLWYRRKRLLHPCRAKRTSRHHRCTFFPLSGDDGNPRLADIKRKTPILAMGGHSARAGCDCSYNACLTR